MKCSSSWIFSAISAGCLVMLVCRLLFFQEFYGCCRQSADIMGGLRNNQILLLLLIYISCSFFSFIIYALYVSIDIAFFICCVFCVGF